MNNTPAQLVRGETVGRGSSLICRGNRGGGQKLHARLLRPYGSREDKQAADRCLRSLRDVDLHDDGLGFGEELATEVPALASGAGVADAAERGTQVPDEEAVHPHGAGVQRRCNAVSPVLQFGFVTWANREHTTDLVVSHAATCQSRYVRGPDQGKRLDDYKPGL